MMLTTPNIIPPVPPRRRAVPLPSLCGVLLPSRPLRPLAPLLPLLALLPLLLCLNGCGPFYALFIDPLIPAPTVRAEYDLSAQRLLIWVDDVGAEPRDPLLRRELTRQVARALTDHQAVASMVDYADIARFRAARPDFVEMTLPEIGQELNADQVLYLRINRFRFHHEAGQGYYRTSLTVSAHIIDVAQGVRVWPTAQTDRVFVQTGRLAEGSGPTFEADLIRSVCRDLAGKITPNFYDHKAPKAMQ